MTPIDPIALLFDAENNATRSLLALLHGFGIDDAGCTLASIDDRLQALFFPKGERTERWEISDTEVPTQEQRKLLAACGFIDETWPCQQYFRYGAWPGALVSRAAVRLLDAARFWTHGVRPWGIVVHTGDRPLQRDRENVDAACLALGVPRDNTAQEIWDSHLANFGHTEYAMMRVLWDILHPHMPEGMEDLVPTWVRAPMKPDKEGNLTVRPSSEDPVKIWRDLKPHPGPILLYSGAPYGMGQAVAYRMLLEEQGFTVDTAGHAAPDLKARVFMGPEVAGTINRIRRWRGV